MRFGDVKAFLKHTKAKKLDEYQKIKPDGSIVKYELHEIPQGEVFRETAYYMIYDDPSTDKVYMSGVEKCSTVAEAMAWKTQMPQASWKRLVPLVTES